jgi:hypothetical protein
MKSGTSKSESVSGFFRQLFKERPDLLKSRSNDVPMRRWLEAHPDFTEVPTNVKQGLSNVKSQLRKHRGLGRGRKAQAADNGAPATPVKVAPRVLEALEEKIDNCLDVVREMGGEGLEAVISCLKRARREVVWKMGH